MIHIDETYLHAMLLRVTNKLRYRIEAHWLAVEQRCHKHVWVMAFDPCRSINKKCKARSVALGKAVFAETFDLLEAIFHELFWIAPLAHALHKSLSKVLDLSRAPEGRHRPAQFTGFDCGEFGGDHRDSHGLLLKQRNAQGSLQNLLQLILVAKPGIGRRNFDRFNALLPAQIGMNHVALDR